MTNPFDVILYRSDDEPAIEAMLKDEDMWMSQRSVSQLFGVSSQTISMHISNIYSEGELDQNPTCTKIEQVQTEGNRQVKRSIISAEMSAC